MKKLMILGTLLVAAAPCFAAEAPAPAQALLQNVNRMRAGLEQEDDRDAEKLKTALGVSLAPRDSGTGLSDMRARVTDNMRNIREPFRCLDVDIEKNSGPVVLVCGNNSGTSAALQQNSSNSGNTIFTAAPPVK